MDAKAAQGHPTSPRQQAIQRNQQPHQISELDGTEQFHLNAEKKSALVQSQMRVQSLLESTDSDE